MKIHPLRNYVLVRPDKAPDKTPGGLHLPDTAQNQEYTVGTVVAVGPGDWMERHLMYRDVAVEKGSRVIFAKYSRNSLKDLGEDTILLREDDIIALVEDDK